jgi:hypothetical protein
MEVLGHAGIDVTMNTYTSCRCFARRRPTPSTSCSEPDVSGFGNSAGNSKGHFMIGSGLWAGALGALGGTRTSNLLIRRFLCRHSDPFRTVRDLGLVSPGCTGGSGSSKGCSSAWLPAWLPDARPEGTTNGFQEHL